jgi:Flp pilus assembly pilin Flp
MSNSKAGIPRGRVVSMASRFQRVMAQRLRETIGESGQGLAEYALILALIALVCVGALGALGVSIAGSPGFTIL